ncbi:hypothetical protein T492DRAFT_889922 [Pavlovales sp. CCMP2436]|nr:hypothetical protein T492DRAFT_889922 [Pavlovales sp. CCMP2436]
MLLRERRPLRAPSSATHKPHRVPHGYICGWPTARGDLYGGNMYLRSAQDPNSLQARATAAALEIWGEGEPGREVIAHPVCKGKYRHFSSAKGEQLFCCFRHSAMRKQRIARTGLLDGWASFDQWPPPQPEVEEAQPETTKR